MNKLLNNIRGWVHNGAMGNALMNDLSNSSEFPKTYSGREFSVFIAEDNDSGGIGTFNTTDAEFQQFDVEGITLPTFSPDQEFEMRSGTGRVAQFGSLFNSTKGVVTEFTLSGRLDLASLSILMQNVTSTAVTTDESAEADAQNVVLLAGGGSYAPTHLEHGGTMAADDFEKTLSVYFKAPTEANSYKMSGGVGTSLNISADMGTSSGRFDYSATFQTKYAVATGTISITGYSEIPNSQIFLSEMAYRYMNMIDVDASDTDYYKMIPIFNTMSLTIESPTQFLGAQGSNAEPQVIARAVPELSITFAGSLKYDSDTHKLLEAHRDQGQGSYIQFFGANKDIGGGTISTSAIFTQDVAFADDNDHSLGILFHKAKLISASVGSGDVATLDFEAKVVDGGSTYEILQVAVGDTNT